MRPLERDHPVIAISVKTRCELNCARFSINRLSEADSPWHIGLHPLNPSNTCAVAPIYLNRGLELFHRFGCFIYREQRTAPVMECLGVLKWRRIATEHPHGGLKMRFRLPKAAFGTCYDGFGTCKPGLDSAP